MKQKFAGNQVEGRFHMFSELDEYLKGFDQCENNLDYWYDEGFIIAQDMLSKFSEDDWTQIEGQLKERSLSWKKRLAYCLDDKENTKEIALLTHLLETKDKELFEIAVDSLRCHTIEKIKSTNSIHKHILNRIINRSQCADSSDVEKKIMKDFLLKMDE